MAVVTKKSERGSSNFMSDVDQNCEGQGHGLPLVIRSLLLADGRVKTSFADGTFLVGRESKGEERERDKLGTA